VLSSIITPDLFASALRMATPLALAAIGGTICERSGVVNIALEGIMLCGAFAGVAVTLAFGNPWLGVVAAVVAGVAIAAIHAFTSINLRSDQVVSGTAINILALGVTGFLMEIMYGHPGTTDSIITIRPVFRFATERGVTLPGTIWHWINTVFLSHTPIVYMAIIIAVVAQWAMYNTRWGLHLRALGEHPRAVDTVGVSVLKGRWVAVLMSGALAGLAGANLTLEQVGSFTENMTNGRGSSPWPRTSSAAGLRWVRTGRRYCSVSPMRSRSSCRSSAVRSTSPHSSSSCCRTCLRSSCSRESWGGRSVPQLSAGPTRRASPSCSCVTAGASRWCGRSPDCSVPCSVSRRTYQAPPMSPTRTTPSSASIGRSGEKSHPLRAVRNT
jgi:ABC-type uncharacterized transport system permease subunit